MRKGNFLIILGVLFLLGAAGFTGYNIYIQNEAARASENALNEVFALNGGERGGYLKGEVFKASVEAGEKLVYPDYMLNPNMDLPTVTVDGYDYAGTLAIPDLGLELPVITPWSYPALRQAPCIYSGTPYLDNMIICAHNYDRHFGRLKELEPGADIYFTDNDGNVFRYQIKEFESMGHWDTRDMISGNYGLTLFTCTIGGRKHVVVRCERKEL